MASWRWGDVHPEAKFAPTAPQLSSRDYAANLVRELEETEGVVPGHEQLGFLALLLEHVEVVLSDRLVGVQTKQRCFLLLGQGGSGKSELINIARKVVEREFGEQGYVAMAYSNSAARGIGGDTIHSNLHLGAQSSLSLDKLGEGVTACLKDKWRDVYALVIDEISLVSPRLFGAASHRVCLARRQTRNAMPELYTEEGYAFGGVPIVILAGDFLQLAPFEHDRSRVSLIMPALPKSWPEHKNGSSNRFFVTFPGYRLCFVSHP